MKLLNKKGMTLFELLAVIVILGIIAAIAFPTVNGLIENSRKDTFVSNANLFVNAAKTNVQDDFTANDLQTQNYVVHIGAVPSYDTTAYPNAKVIDLTSEFDLTGYSGYIIVEVSSGSINSVVLNNYTDGPYTITTYDVTTNGSITRDDIDAA